MTRYSLDAIQTFSALTVLSRDHAFWHGLEDLPTRCCILKSRSTNRRLAIWQRQLL